MRRRSNRPTGVFKLKNQYMDLIDPKLYATIPKSVFAAIAVSLTIIRHEDDQSGMNAKLLEEWQALFDNGIVPQKPPYFGGGK